MSSKIYEYTKSMNYSTGDKETPTSMQSDHPIPTIARGNVFQKITAFWWGKVGGRYVYGM